MATVSVHAFSNCTRITLESGRDTEHDAVEAAVVTATAAAMVVASSGAPPPLEVRLVLPSESGSPWVTVRERGGGTPGVRAAGGSASSNHSTDLGRGVGSTVYR
jgi:hypothetical protein